MVGLGRILNGGGSRRELFLLPSTPDVDVNTHPGLLTLHLPLPHPLTPLGLQAYAKLNDRGTEGLKNAPNIILHHLASLSTPFTNSKLNSTLAHLDKASLRDEATDRGKFTDMDADGGACGLKCIIEGGA